MKIRVKNWVKSRVGIGLGLLAFQALPGYALELDWSGQFWSEFNFIKNYAMDTTDAGQSVDTNRSSAGGYYIRGGGTQDASFQTIFLRLRPKLVVNDNIYIKSEWWIGDPIYGLFGAATAYPPDQRQYYMTNSRGSLISAQRIWGEFLSDVGTFQAGRVPLNWGLGVVWDSGEDFWNRYMSTGDAVRWIAKFGSFSFVPSVIVPSSGNTISGACLVSSGVCNPTIGSGGVVDFSIILKYENIEEDLEGGVNILRRLGGASQDPNFGILTPTNGATEVAGSMNFTLFDFYLKKKLNEFRLGAEVPIVTGSIGAFNYNSFAVAGEMGWKPSDTLDMLLKVGYAPGQAAFSGAMGTLDAFYFNPNYHIAMIMFNYQLANFAGAQTLNNPTLVPNNLRSPYDNPIVNAFYASFAPAFTPWEKWTIRPALVYAAAPQGAKAGQSFYNYWTRTIQSTAVADQELTLGWEFDLGLTFRWDEYFQFNFDNGLFFPGGFYKFSNYAGKANETAMVWASSVRVGVHF